MIARKKAALMAEGLAHRGEPSPCFVPDFSQDTKYYQEIDSLNEVSVAQSKHYLHDIAAVHLQEMPVVEMPSLDDDTNFDNIVPKSTDINQMYEYARTLENEIRSSNNKENA